MSTVTSADGTTIGYEATGSGPALLLVDGAFSSRSFGRCRLSRNGLGGGYGTTVTGQRAIRTR